MGVESTTNTNQEIIAVGTINGVDQRKSVPQTHVRLIEGQECILRSDWVVTVIMELWHRYRLKMEFHTHRRIGNSIVYQNKDY